MRRAFMAAMLMLVVIEIVLGSALLNHWLSSSIPRFVLFWGFVMLQTIALLLLCLYDLLRTWQNR